MLSRIFTLGEAYAIRTRRIKAWIGRGFLRRLLLRLLVLRLLLLLRLGSVDGLSPGSLLVVQVEGLRHLANVVLRVHVGVVAVVRAQGYLVVQPVGPPSVVLGHGVVGSRAHGTDLGLGSESYHAAHLAGDPSVGQHGTPSHGGLPAPGIGRGMHPGVLRRGGDPVGGREIDAAIPAVALLQREVRGADHRHHRRLQGGALLAVQARLAFDLAEAVDNTRHSGEHIMQMHIIVAR